MRRKKKPVLALDFDGVLRLNENTPTPGALKAVREYLKYFEVNVYAARSARPGGPQFMRAWLKKHGFPVHQMKFPKGKPEIHALIDDQAVPHFGRWPSVGEIAEFHPFKLGAHDQKCPSCGGSGIYVETQSDLTYGNQSNCFHCKGAGRMASDLIAIKEALEEAEDRHRRSHA